MEIRENLPKCSVEEMHRVHLELLRELKRVCDNNNIKYYLACGTCLGAVRHKGFIPWDHDADVFMYYEETEKLKGIKDQFGEQFFLQSKETDPEFDSICLRLRKSNTTLITTDSLGMDINQGIDIDIYPLYYAPENKYKLHYYIILSYLLRLLVANHEPRNHSKALAMISILVLKVIGKSRNKIVSSIWNILSSVHQSSKVLTYFGLDVSLVSAITYDSSWFNIPTKIEFEGEEFSAPTDPYSYLEQKYGNYLELPSEEIRNTYPKEIVIADTSLGYTSYKEIYLSREERI